MAGRTGNDPQGNGCKAGRTVRDYNAAYIAKQSVTALDAAKALGLRPDRHGRCACPVHHGRDRNCKLGGTGYHCFVCGAHGDVIDLVMAVNGCSFQSALNWLNSAFNLGLTMYYTTDKNAAKAIKSGIELKRMRDDNVRSLEALQFDLLTTAQRLYCLNEQDLDRFAPVHPYRAWSRRYAEAARFKVEIQDLIERIEL